MGLALLLTPAGCLPVKDEPLPTVKPSPFGPSPVARAPQRQLSPASKQEALRVDIVGQKLLQANRECGLRPVFQTIGAPNPELFHRGTECLYITEGLAKQCRTEGQLAAVLAHEMARMVAEREALASPEMRRPERLPPMRSNVGGDAGGAFGPSDGTQLAELAKYEKERPRPAAPPPDPRVLARSYLEKAGFTAKDLEEAGPLLRQARGHNDFERQLSGSPAVRPGPQ
jgi:hypothetical protein